MEVHIAYWFLVGPTWDTQPSIFRDNEKLQNLFWNYEYCVQQEEKIPNNSIGWVKIQMPQINTTSEKEEVFNLVSKFADLVLSVSQQGYCHLWTALQSYLQQLQHLSCLVRVA